MRKYFSLVIIFILPAAVLFQSRLSFEELISRFDEIVSRYKLTLFKSIDK